MRAAALIPLVLIGAIVLAQLVSATEAGSIIDKSRQLRTKGRKKSLERRCRKESKDLGQMSAKCKKWKRKQRQRKRRRRQRRRRTEATEAGDDDALCPAQDAALGLLNLNSWPVQTSCGYFFSTTNDRKTQRIAFRFSPNQDSVIFEEGITWTTTFDESSSSSSSSSPGIVSGSLEMTQGSNLDHYDCNDAIEIKKIPVETARWNAIAGTAECEITELVGEDHFGIMTFKGTVRLKNVLLALQSSSSGGDDDDDCTVSIPDASWENMFMGWTVGR